MAFFLPVFIQRVAGVFFSSRASPFVSYRADDSISLFLHRVLGPPFPFSLPTFFPLLFADRPVSSRPLREPLVSCLRVGNAGSPRGYLPSFFHLSFSFLTPLELRRLQPSANASVNADCVLVGNGRRCGVCSTALPQPLNGPFFSLFPGRRLCSASFLKLFS